MLGHSQNERHALPLHGAAEWFVMIVVAAVCLAGCSSAPQGLLAASTKLESSTILPRGMFPPRLQLPSGELLGVVNELANPKLKSGIYAFNATSGAARPFWLPPKCAEVAAMALGGSAKIYVTGDTGNCLRPTAGAAQPKYGGGTSDAFVVILNSKGRVSYESYLGGKGLDSGRAIAANFKGDAAITGLGFLPAGFGPKTAGSFVASFDSGGKRQYKVTIPGTVEQGVALDSNDHVYVTGQAGQYFKATKGAFQTSPPRDTLFNGYIDELSPTGRVMYATYLGGPGNKSNPMAVTLACNGCIAVHDGRVTVAGATNSSHFPLKNAVQSRYGGAG